MQCIAVLQWPPPPPKPWSGWRYSLQGVAAPGQAGLAAWPPVLCFNPLHLWGGVAAQKAGWTVALHYTSLLNSRVKTQDSGGQPPPPHYGVGLRWPRQYTVAAGSLTLHWPIPS